MKYRNSLRRYFKMKAAVAEGTSVSTLAKRYRITTQRVYRILSKGPPYPPGIHKRSGAKCRLCENTVAIGDLCPEHYFKRKVNK